MTDKRGEEVPKHKLTKDQIGFQKKFKNMLEIKYFLDSKAAKIQGEVKDLRELYRGLGMAFKGLQPPQEGTHELDGMGFAEESPQGTPEDSMQR